MSAPSEPWECYFDPGETLLWQGAPAPGLRITPLMVIMSLFGLASMVFGGLAIMSGIAEISQLQSAPATGFGAYILLLGLPFAGIGAALTVGPWYAALRAHDKVSYALSDRRAYVARSWWKRKLESYPIGPDDPIELQKGRTDTVWFSTVLGFDSEGSPTRERTAFHNITDGRRVYALLRQIQAVEL